LIDCIHTSKNGLRNEGGTVHGMGKKIYRKATLLGCAAKFGWLVVVCSVALITSSGQGAEITIAGQAAVLMELRTGKILWRRNENLSLAPASTTKIMTALVALERSNLSDTVVVPEEATLSTGGTVRLQAGERLTVQQLLYGMLLQSGNDAAIALAKHSGGSLAKFVRLMNDKAHRLSALQSRFRNPTGLPQSGHVTTAHDLAVITRAALANPAFRKIVATQDYPWKSAKWQGTLKNSNVLLNTYEGAIGVKTGQTREAGFCFVAAAERGSETFVAVILNSAEKSGWQDAKNLLDHGFKNFSSMSLIEPGETILTSQVDGKKVAIAAAASAHYVGPASDADPPQMHIALDELALPIAKGEKVGEAIFRKGDKELARVDLISRVAVPGQFNTLWLPAAASALLLALLFIWRRRHRRRHRHIFAGRGNRLRF
jgi:serine-type D-Ala-D-Ala carboxypeptidase (penicillin-binding protein 5/6)